MRPCCNWLLALHCLLIPAFALNQAHSTEVRDRSLAQIDALVARNPTLIFNIPEAVIEDEDDNLFAKDALSTSPKASEQDYSTGFKKSYRLDGRNGEEIEEELHGVRLKQAKRQQVSARIVKQRDMGLNAHPSPSPSPRPALETITTLTLLDGTSKVKSVQLPTPFPFDLHLFGRRFAGSEVYVNEDGYLRLSHEGDASGQDSAMAEALPSSSLGTYALAPYWSEFHIPPNSADYGVTYTFTSNSVTVGWRVLQDGVQQTSHAKGLCHFELTYLTDRPDYVEFIYMGDSDPSCLSGESASIGVQSDEGAYQFAYAEEDSIKPGMKLIFNTVTGELDILT